MLALLVACLSGSAAAQRLHNQRRDSIVQDIKKQFDDSITPENDVFDQALSLAAASEEEDLKQLRERNRVLQDSLSATLPLMTWREFRELAFNARRSGLTIYAGTAPGPDASVGNRAGLDEERKDLRRRIDRFDALFRSQSDLINSIQQALDSAVKGKKKLALDLSALPSKTAEWREDLARLRQIALRLAPAPPGPLGLELTLTQFRTELERLRMQQDHRKDRESALRKLQSDLQAYAGTAPGDADCLKSGERYEAFGQFAPLLKSLCESSYDPGRKIIDDLRDLASSGGGATNAPAGRQLRAALTDLTRLVHLAGAARYELLAEAADLSQEDFVFQVRQIRLQMRDHEALLQAGINGLAAFEAGGIQPRDALSLLLSAHLLLTTTLTESAK